MRFLRVGVSIPRAPSGASARLPSGRVSSSGKRQMSFNPPGAFGGKCKTNGEKPLPKEAATVSIPRAPSGASASGGTPSPMRARSPQFQSPGRLRGQVQAPEARKGLGPLTFEFQSPGRLRGQVQGAPPCMRMSSHSRIVSIPRAPSGASARVGKLTGPVQEFLDVSIPRAPSGASAS